MTRGRSAAWGRRRMAAASARPSISGICMSRMATSNTSPWFSHARASGPEAAACASICHEVACKVSMRRLVALSSTSSRRLPDSSDWSPGGQVCPGAASACKVKWKMEPWEGRALRPHVTAHQLGQALADGQPKTTAPEAAGGRGVYLAEGMEQAVHALGRDAEARITDADMQLVTWRRSVTGHRRPVVCGQRPGVHRHHHFTFFGELDGVAEQVARIWRTRVTSPTMAGGTPSSKI